MYPTLSVSGSIPWSRHLGPWWASLPQVATLDTRLKRFLLTVWSCSDEKIVRTNSMRSISSIQPIHKKHSVSLISVNRWVNFYDLQSQLKHWCLGSRRPWDHQALPQRHQRVTEGSQRASRNSLQDSLTHSQGRCHCTVVVRRITKKVIFAGKIVRHRWVAPKW